MSLSAIKKCSQQPQMDINEGFSQNKSLQQKEWVACFLDGKFYLTNQSAYQRLKNLDNQINQQKNRLVRVEAKEKVILPQQIKIDTKEETCNQVSHRKNSFQSEMSRDCRTEVNELKTWKAKFIIEKQLVEEEKKLNHKTLEMRKRRELIIPQNQLKYRQDVREVSQRSRKSSSKSFMMAPHQLANQKEDNQKQVVKKSERKSGIVKVDQSKNSRISSKIQQSKVGRAGSKSRYERQSGVDDDISHPGRDEKLSNSKQKSFVISKRFSHAKQKDEKSESDKNNIVSESPSVIESLNRKLKQMQNKLQKVEAKQRQIDEKQSTKIKQKKQNPHVNSNKQQKVQKKVQQTQKQKYIQIVKKEDCIQKQQKLMTKMADNGLEINQSQTSRKISMSRYRSRKLDFESSIIFYNKTQELFKQKQQEDEIFYKQRMSEEIVELKKVIKNLKIQKIKQEVIIHELEHATKKQNNFVDESFTFNGTTSQVSSLASRSNKAQETFKTIEDAKHIKKQHNFTKKVQQYQDTEKKQVRRILKSRPPKSIRNSEKTESIGRSDSQQRTLANPEDGSASRQKCQLKRKGVIIRQRLSRQKKYNTIGVKNSTDLDQESNYVQQSKVSKVSSIEKQQNEMVKPTQLDLSQFIRPKIDILETEAIQTFPIPEIPNTPSQTANQSELLGLAKKVCDLFEIKISQKDQLQFKKFKNCVILKATSTNKAIVWHFTGKFYIGDWAKDNGSQQQQKNGEGFEFIPEKHYYKGSFKNNKKSGFGTMIMLDGDIYKGKWSNGEKQGKGIFYEKKTNSYYEGQWKDGKKEGPGKFKVSQTQFYEGGFNKNYKNGFGTQVFPNGDLYVGDYLQGKFQGKGKYFWSNGSVYVGQFENGQRNGFGRWVSGIVDQDYYIGNYKNDKKQGKGRYQWAKGCIFEGEFKVDLKNGMGSVYYPDGREVKGVWEFGKLKQFQKKKGEKNNIDETQILENIECRIRPNFPKVFETPTRTMQTSSLIQGI